MKLPSLNLPASSKPAQPPQAHPPLFLFVSGLILLVAISGMLGYAALRNAEEFKMTLHSLEQSWEARLNARALPEQGAARRDVEADQAYIARVDAQYGRLHHMLAFAIGGLAFLVLLAFAIYRYALVIPLRNLERSCRELTENGMRGHVWGLDRPDIYGNLARSISELRKGVEQLADMTVEGPDGVHLIRFSGRGGAAFNTLINDLQVHVRTLQETGTDMRRRLEQSADHWQKKAEIMGDAVMQTSSGLHEAVESSRKQLDVLHGSHLGVQNEAKRLVARFEADMEALKEIAIATGQRIAQTLTTLNASDRDLRRAAQQNLEASDLFSRHAAELSEKLVAATNLMRASGKVMSETTEAARTRFVEAVKSVEAHDEALRTFLSETAGKTDQIAGLYDSLAGNTERIGYVVQQLDNRMQEFDTQSRDAFGRIATGAGAIDLVTTRLNGAHETMAASMDAMRGHTEMLTRLLGTMRDEYTGMMDSVRTSIAEADPAIAQLKEASQGIHDQLQYEWSQYAEQSRDLLAGLEKDVRAIHLRTVEVGQSTENLIADIRTETTHLQQSANNFDLQVAGVSERIEGAVTAVSLSNQHIATATARQMEEIYTAVNEMAQRLAILSQLTGTLGAVAGQLGQIVPGLSDATQLARTASSSLGHVSANPRMEQLHKDFSEAIAGMRGEFEGVKGQITRWVETLSGGYQRLAEQISGMDGVLEAKLSQFASSMPVTSSLAANAPAIQVNASDIASKLAPSLQLIHASLADENAFNQRVAANIESLRTDLSGLREQAASSSGTLKRMNELLADGFNRLHEEEAAAPAAHGPAPALIEKLEKITQEMNLSDMHEVMSRLKNVTDSLEKLTELGIDPGQKVG